MGAKGTGFYDTYESELDEDQLKLLEELEKEQEALRIKESLSLGEFAKIFRIESALQGKPEALQNKTDHDIYNEAEKRNNPLAQKVFKGVLFDKLAPGGITVETPEEGINYPLADVKLPAAWNESFYRHIHKNF